MLKNQTGMPYGRITTKSRTSEKYDLFVRIGGEAFWLAAFASLQDALDRMRSRVSAWPGEYFVFDQTSFRIVAATEGPRRHP